MKDIGDKAGEAKSYGNSGLAYHSLRDFNKAIESHEKSLEIDKDIGDKAGEAKCYINLGIVYHSLGDFNKAIEYHEKSLKIFKDVGDKAGESMICGNLGYIYYNTHDYIDYNKSWNYVERAIKFIELVRESDITEELGKSFFKTKFDVYDLGVDVALKLYETTEKEEHLKNAFEIIEKTKSRELVKKLNLKETIPEKPENIKFDAVERFREVIKNKPKCTVIEMYQQSDRIIYLLLTENKIKLYEQKIDPDVLEELIGEYFTVSAYLFNKLDRESSEELNEIIENKSDPFLNKLIGKYGRGEVRSMMSKVGTFHAALNEVISYIVPEKLRTGLDSIKTDYLIVLPHRWLHDISWEAAVINEKPLGLRYNLIRNYNLDLVTSNLNYSHHPFKNALIAFNLYKKENGLKTYTGILEDECNAVKNKLKDYEVKYFSKEQATWDNIKKDLHDASLVHFHCHGSFSPENPLESSGIELYKDHFISAKDILSEKIEFKNHPIILLRGCKTGRIGTDNIGTMGDEQMGLVTSFFTAKASTLIVTGWSTYTEYGKEFSNYFYDSLLEGKNVAESLKYAREKIYEKFGNKSRDWAAYMLYGNPFKFI
ncbi:hypothetical protein BEH94_00115 [Candidatus Altiarchaeales archaeon WOR_SM1_SCG]|nr:hypothetical protein BEH94_00115 [Candidatus Altiarchaeales archaeon WOR_SM1_SCG]